MDISLQKRRSQNIDPFHSKLNTHTHTHICTELQAADILSDFRVSSHPSAGHTKGIEDIDMNAVRLCFECELEWEDGMKDSLSPVVSTPIYDKSK